ncbi:MAG TPA: NADH-quinone oxidoreductase subunit L, partial [Tepidisphaeraceae bacterium]|nr:NADH-quinone oxidoreductase subunit L [Tepidisphaeraceae bacterium]
MPTPALLLLTATLLPLVSFALLVFVGRRMGNPLAGYVATSFVAASFGLSVWALGSWLIGGTYVEPVTGQPRVAWGAGKLPINLPYQWLPVGTADDPHGLRQDHAGYLDVGIYVDSLTITMFAMVTLVATLVHVFSLGYMASDVRFPRYFTYLGLFCFAMLGLVLGGTLVQVFVFWELVGLCSYLLIGFWYERKSASDAAVKAFVVNRVGDFGFLIGFGILFYHAGNASLPHLWAMLGTAGNGADVALPGGAVMGAGLLTLAGAGLFFGAVGKSAQFPLHVWLPDAMAGPTPVSALIHAATMVAAGVYLVGRIFPILTPDAKLFVAVIGCTTLVMAALIAVAQTDIKKVLAYSTLSQLGYMMLALGVGSWVGGLFHLVTHAFFKALLFLGAGSVIHAAHHEQDVRQYGGLIRRLPVTAVTFAVAVLAIAGTPGLSGYYSKSVILVDAARYGFLAEALGKSGMYWLLFILPAATAYVTAFYMTRCWMLTFAGAPRNPRLHEHAREGPVMWIPLVALAVMSVVAGYGSTGEVGGIGVPYLLRSATTEASRYVELITGRPADVFAAAWPQPVAAAAGAPTADTDAPAGDAHAVQPTLYDLAHHREQAWVGYAFAVGTLLAVLVYARGLRTPAALLRFPPLRILHAWLANKMYIDEL